MADIIAPPGAMGGAIRLQDMALQSPESVDIRGGKVVRLREFHAFSGKIDAFKAGTIEADSISAGSVDVTGTLSINGSEIVYNDMSLYALLAGATFTGTVRVPKLEIDGPDYYLDSDANYLYLNFDSGGDAIWFAKATNKWLFKVGGSTVIDLTPGLFYFDTGAGFLSTNGQFVTTLATGTAPLNVASTTRCANLNADMVDGIHAAGFAQLALATLQDFAGNVGFDSGSIRIGPAAGTYLWIRNDGKTSPDGVTYTQIGNVKGPASATVANFAAFNAADGKTIADTGYGPLSFAAISHNHTGTYAPLSHTHDAGDITSGTLNNARVNWASPSAIGGTSAAAGTFTTLRATSVNLISGTTGTPSEPFLAVFANGDGAGLSIGWNKLGGGGTGETDFVNYGQGGGGGFAFYNFPSCGGVWTSTGPTLLAEVTNGGELKTTDPGGGKGAWMLGKYTGSALTISGYVETKIDGTVRKLAVVT